MPLHMKACDGDFTTNHRTGFADEMTIASIIMQP